jgi:hypothetical protein
MMYVLINYPTKSICIITINCSKTAAFTSSKTNVVLRFRDVDCEVKVNFFSKTVQEFTLFLSMLFISHMLNFNCTEDRTVSSPAIYIKVISYHTVSF